MTHYKWCKGVKQKFSKEREEGTTKSGFERRNWEATKPVNVVSSVVGVRDSVGGKEMSEGQDKESIDAFQGVKKHFRREGEAQTELPDNRPTD